MDNLTREAVAEVLEELKAATSKLFNLIGSMDVAAGKTGLRIQIYDVPTIKTLGKCVVTPLADDEYPWRLQTQLAGVSFVAVTGDPQEEAEASA